MSLYIFRNDITHWPNNISIRKLKIKTHTYGHRVAEGTRIEIKRGIQGNGVLKQQKKEDCE